VNSLPLPDSAFLRSTGRKPHPAACLLRSRERCENQTARTARGNAELLSPSSCLTGSAPFSGQYATDFRYGLCPDSVSNHPGPCNRPGREWRSLGGRRRCCRDDYAVLCASGNLVQRCSSLRTLTLHGWQRELDVSCRCQAGKHFCDVISVLSDQTPIGCHQHHDRKAPIREILLKIFVCRNDGGKAPSASAVRRSSPFCRACHPRSNAVTIS
jgi:hypothetical protein